MRKSHFNKPQESALLDEAGEVLAVAEEEPLAEPVAPKAHLVSRVVYKACYAVSYAAVFSSLLASKLLIPKDSPVEHGLHDGAIAAREAVEEKARLIVEVAEQTEVILSGEEPPAVAA